ncbi:hypothetical protein CY34DRAFT_760170 [Suillus luteus UH-Slu-Lm8-n1]|uniref:Unplaced genomic scaffold CY34scaffold_1229, whole genome shotgun sequence n=1 Tax=Suillus luteus UH-Slu-Lm8-n1 TaxID=930992 RepID=A0A0D0A1Y4_9AGAM|nr:hypothetical protein CY34DRAFT_760170 [Suillus luteus UH-Slu-Lm8-n1]
MKRARVHHRSSSKIHRGADPQYRKETLSAANHFCLQSSAFELDSQQKTVSFASSVCDNVQWESRIDVAESGARFADGFICAWAIVHCIVQGARAQTHSSAFP